MINGLGVLGWGVGGIEAEAAMLGQPVSMLIPQVVGFKLSGTLPEGATATDLVLTVTQMLRKEGRRRQVCRVLRRRPRGDCRSPIGPRSPTWPPNTARRAASSRSTPRPCAISSSRAGPRRRSAWSRPTTGAGDVSRGRTPPRPIYTDTLELDLATVQPSLAGPRRPQDRVTLGDAKTSFHKALQEMLAAETGRPRRSRASRRGSATVGRRCRQRARARTVSRTARS